MALFWTLIFGMVNFCAYNAELISQLTVHTTWKLNSMEELHIKSSQYQLVLVKGYASLSYFRESQVPKIREIWEDTMEPHPEYIFDTAHQALDKLKGECLLSNEFVWKTLAVHRDCKTPQNFDPRSEIWGWVPTIH